MSGQDSDDAKPYQEKMIAEAVDRVKGSP